MKRNIWKILAWVGFLSIVILIVIRQIDIRHHPKRVASILNIPSLPASVRVIDCKAAFIPTDVVDTCSIEVATGDFSKLLIGYNYSELQTKSTSHTAVFTKVGPEFPIATEFIAEPKEFKHGGSVKVFTDKERKRAVIDLYIE